MLSLALLKTLRVHSRFLPASVCLLFIHSARLRLSICSVPSTVLGARRKDEKAKILLSQPRVLREVTVSLLLLCVRGAV